jgi:hypothetical protein
MSSGVGETLLRCVFDCLYTIYLIFLSQRHVMHSSGRAEVRMDLVKILLMSASLFSSNEISDVGYTRPIEFQYLKILHLNVVNGRNNVVKLAPSCTISIRSVTV